MFELSWPWSSLLPSSNYNQCSISWKTYPSTRDRSENGYKLKKLPENSNKTSTRQILKIKYQIFFWIFNRNPNPNSTPLRQSQVKVFHSSVVLLNSPLNHNLWFLSAIGASLCQQYSPSTVIFSGDLWIFLSLNDNPNQALSLCLSEFFPCQRLTL